VLGARHVEVVVPGTDPAPYIADPPDLRDGRAIAILCVANWLPAKNVAELVAAFKELPTSVATLHLVGDTSASRSYGSKIERLVRTSSLRDRVVVHGSLDPDAIAPLRAGADVFALPSLEESYGMAWAEAMAAGLPVVGWDTSNLPNLITHGSEGLLMPTGDTKLLTSTLATLAMDTALRIRLGKAAKRKAAEFPTWAETARHFVSVAREAAGQPVPR
jgi:glycosyltransferase involved in cell wall biosynthesis